MPRKKEEKVKAERKEKKEAEVTSWADRVAEQVMARKKKEFVFEGMWTPSGFFHIGNARPEIFTPYSVKKAMEDKGFKCRQNFIIDDFDAVRKIPLGLNIKEEDKGKYIGFPCATAPSPLPGFKTWADCFVSQVKKFIPYFGVELNFISAFETYKKGKMNDLIKQSLEHSREIVQIWNEVAGTEKPLDFVPLQVLCEKCKKIYFTKVTGWNKEKELVSYECQCGHKGEVSPYNGQAKLHWRVHWASHWILNKVDFESAGKDHFSKGGSVDVGQAMLRRVFKVEPPIQIPTEFIQIGGAKMAGSVGNVINLEEWLKVALPEMFRFLNFSYKPNSVIEFSFTTNSFILLNERFERAERIFYGLEKAENEKIQQKIKRAYALSLIKPKAKRLVQVPFAYCVQLVQLMPPEKEFNKILEKLKETKHVPEDISAAEKTALKEKLFRAQHWVKTYAPKEFKLRFLEELTPEIKAKLTPEIKKVFQKIVEALPEKKTPEEVQQLVFDSAKAVGLPARKAFQGVYLVLFGEPYGPKVSSLVALFGQEKIRERLKQAL